jgi:hypothetical protein
LFVINSPIVVNFANFLGDKINFTIFMTKKIITEKTSGYLENLIDEIPIEQRKRMVKSKAYREGWLDSTMFCKIQFDNTFKR